MFDSVGFVGGVLVLWLAIGTGLSVVMGRRGHNSFAWLVLGTLLGPLALILAFEASQHQEDLHPAVAGIAPVAPGKGPIDVLVGYDGSPAAESALKVVVSLLGERVGRLTAATVVPFGDVWEEEQSARDALEELAARSGVAGMTLEVLHGRPATALRQFALEGDYDLVAVGTQGKGISKALLGSAATGLAREERVIVLLVGGGVAREEGVQRVA